MTKEGKNMASFYTSIENKYSVDSFQSVKNTYYWIIESLNKLNIIEKSFSARFLFDTGQITCSAEGIDEFVQHAYGSSNFSFTECSIHTKLSDNNSVAIYLKHNNTIRVCCEDKVLLQNIIDILNRTDINEQSDKTVNNITINGGNNAIANNNSTATIVSNSKKVNISNSNNSKGEITNKESKIRTVFNAIMTNLASNFIWYLLCVLAGALVAYFISKQ